VSTYLAIGSICWDEVPVEGQIERRLGGSVLFAARIAREAGWQAVVVTSGTEPLADAAREALPGVEVLVQPSEHDTVMRFEERTELGPRRVPTVADPIDLDRVPDAARAAGSLTADIVHLAPILGEVTPRLVGQVTGARLLGVTPQGLLRERDEVGRLGLVRQVDPWWAAGVDAVVASEEEHGHLGQALAGAAAAVAVTRGEAGCWGRQGAIEVDLPGVAVEPSPAGTIGAGDVFAATLFLGLAEGQGFAAAMDRANRRAAAHVAGQAPD
jgi:sugar/nucleoside kinase (ribokinase family)